MITTLCVDVGGVLLRPRVSPELQRWEQRLGMPQDTAVQTFYGGARGAEVARGAISDDALWERIGQERHLQPEELAAVRRAVLDAHVPDEALVALVRRLRARYRTAVISNAPSSLRHALHEVYRIADAFDLIVCSAEEGILKPDPEIYARALSRLDCPPAAALLIDDRADNVAAARAFGMQALLVTPELDLPSALLGFGVGLPAETGE